MNKMGFSCSLSEEEEYEACEKPLFVTATWEQRENGEGGERPGVCYRI